MTTSLFFARMHMRALYHYSNCLDFFHSSFFLFLQSLLLFSYVQHRRTPADTASAISDPRKDNSTVRSPMNKHDVFREKFSLLFFLINLFFDFCQKEMEVSKMDGRYKAAV